MKGRSIRTRVTLWFSVSLIIVVLLSFISFMIVSRTVVEKTTLNILRDAVENNLDEVEFHDEIINDEMDQDSDYYMKYSDGWLEIDDDFLSSVNGVYCTVYDVSPGCPELIYGENPIADITKACEFSNRDLQKIVTDGVEYHIYDRKVRSEGLKNVWIRGVISDEQNAGDVHTIAEITIIILIAILIIAILGGNIIAGRMLNPISSITKAASKISRGNDLKERIDIGEGKDEVHELADSFNKMMERLEVAFADEQQFTSDVSHELRTPISVIMAQSEFALENSNKEDDYIDALETVKRQAGKMSKLVNDMLTFARLGRNSGVYEKIKMNLSEVVESISEDMALIEEKGIKLECEAEPDVFVNGNRELLSRLIVNLIGNAYKYGKDEGHIWVKVKVAEGKAYLTVEDDGIGIAEDEIPKISKRMYQVDSSRNDKGSGLGLYMVKEIAEFHGGRIMVESRLNHGSKFIFEISTF